MSASEVMPPASSMARMTVGKPSRLASFVVLPLMTT
jgi:hypothetical protein